MRWRYRAKTFRMAVVKGVYCQDMTNEHADDGPAAGAILTTIAGATLKASDLLSVGQAAAYLHLSVSCIRSYLRQGTLKGFRVAGLRKVLIPRHEILALLEPARPAEP